MRTKKEIKKRMDEYQSIIRDLQQSRHPIKKKIYLYVNQLSLLDWVLGE